MCLDLEAIDYYLAMLAYGRTPARATWKWFLWLDKALANASSGSPNIG